jgi:hypothetical protein
MLPGGTAVIAVFTAVTQRPIRWRLPCRVLGSLAPVLIWDCPCHQGVVDERAAERAVDLGKVFWNRLADRVGDLNGRLFSVVGFRHQERAY